ncbi:endolytic transglycosylase MltG [Rhizosaccharibacter radicis]|uniref:Endolytic murein transglycosylase n=1 Tax=Rhizosaccharibacter radicis TaxID=2782605 RepID=A0ABT1VZL3_9PROT|nr:endolytic transglycosylase MltG [Acetobacteraceae bacterium KSS12]
MRRLLVLIPVLFLLLVAGAGAGAVLMARQAGPLPETTSLVVPHGRTDGVARALQRHGVLADGTMSRLLFRALVASYDRHAPLHAAEFSFPAHASMMQVLAILRHGRPVQHELTIPEGLTAAQIAAIIDKADTLEGPLVVPAEGSVLPETYAFERGTTRMALLARMEAAMRRALSQVWEGREPNLPLSDPQQMLVLASIVERETGVAAERPMVAAVFLNRLRQNMKLQSDPTVAYDASGGLGTLPRPLTRSDLLQPGPYNTYLIPALPAGPISAPGLASLRAVAHPAATGALYFVATGTGGHAFADTLPEHLQNVARLRALEAGHPEQVPTIDPLRPPPQTVLPGAPAPGARHRHGHR